MTDPDFVLNLLHTAFSVPVAMILLSNVVTLHVFPKVVKVSFSLELLVLKINFWFAYCLLCRLQPGLRWVPGLASKAENVFVDTPGVVFTFLFRLRELQMCIPHTLLRSSRFVSLLGLLIFHPR